jgi:response regulator NasT
MALANFQHRRQLNEKVDELEEKLTSRKMIDRAKGFLMKDGMSEEEAYHYIQLQARSRRTTMSKVAQEVIDKNK